MSNIVQRTKKEAPHLERFEDTRKYNDGRLKTRKMSPEEKIAFSSQKKDKERLAKGVNKTGKYIKAIESIIRKTKKA